MDVATVSANGQITLPVEMRRRLGLAPGDKVAFIENEQGDIVVVRPSVAALLKAQRLFAAGEDDLGADTNVLVSALRSPGSVADHAVQRILDTDQLVLAARTLTSVGS